RQGTGLFGMAKRRNERMQDKPMAARRGGYLRQQRRDTDEAETAKPSFERRGDSAPAKRERRDDNFGNRERRDENAPRKPYGVNKGFKKF
ncbi:MAG: ribosomal large subunit pseudouridine synthase B, partial [Acinetobacter sp.]|nr:ribosomal large subunit pseudouridine synthase B [Acinetobacter sp.]